LFTKISHFATKTKNKNKNKKTRHFALRFFDVFAPFPHSIFDTLVTKNDKKTFSSQNRPKSNFFHLKIAQNQTFFSQKPSKSNFFGGGRPLKTQ